ncbi:MAG TPA: hypothetical protein EYH54_01545 [Nautiliaceae bacterium]|nr:hypothetical protein [Nautiliaceae bacterium]
MDSFDKLIKVSNNYLLISTDWGILKDIIVEMDDELNWKVLEMKIREKDYSKMDFLKSLKSYFNDLVFDKILLDFTENYFLDDNEKDLKKEVENFIIYHALKSSIDFDKKIEVIECKSNKELSYIVFSDIYPIFEDKENREIIFLKGFNKLLPIECSKIGYKEVFDTLNKIKREHSFDSLENNMRKLRTSYFPKRLKYDLYDFSEQTLRENKQKSAKNLSYLLKIFKEQDILNYKDLLLCNTSFNYKNCLKI